MIRRNVAAAVALALTLGASLVGTTPAGAATGRIATVKAGESHTCALLPTGTVRCWGLSNSGQIGNGTTSGFARKPQKVPSVSGAIAIAAGEAHTCALIQTGTVKCWGANYGGQLGNGTIRDAPKPVNVTGLNNVTAISAGSGHTCALLEGGNVKCWGFNNSGVLGNGTTTTKTKPASVTGLSGVASISTGNQDTCALLKNGTVKCWGYNGDGELGTGTTNGPQSCDAGEFSTACSTTPLTVQGLGAVAAVNVGNNSVCALLKNGTVECWGSNNNGELGNGTTKAALTPVKVKGLSTVTALSSGGVNGNYTCALLKIGTVKCWGYNGEGELGNGTTSPALTPVSVAGLGGATSITTGGRHACAELKDAVAKCWGENIYGQLGNGTTKNATKPTVVVFL